MRRKQHEYTTHFIKYVLAIALLCFSAQLVTDTNKVKESEIVNVAV